MNTRDLNKLLMNNDYTKRYYLGTFPACRTPKSRKKVYSFITNTDEHDKPGKHWVAWVVRGKEVKFFDSFGRSPYDNTFPHDFVDILERFERCIFVSEPVQKPGSPWCGLHCIHFIFMMLAGLDVEDFLENYKTSDIISIVTEILN